MSPELNLEELGALSARDSEMIANLESLSDDELQAAIVEAEQCVVLAVDYSTMNERDRRTKNLRIEEKRLEIEELEAELVVLQSVTLPNAKTDERETRHALRLAQKVLAERVEHEDEA